MIVEAAERTREVREYYFSRKNRQIAELNARRDTPVINLGIGSPDRRPPQEAIDTLCDMAQQDGVHAYQSYLGAPQLREAFARWYERYYDVKLDPSCEIQPLTGSKEGILLLSLAFLDKGDKVLVPDPGYPTYTSASRLCEAQILSYDLREEDGWMPDFDALEAMDLSGVKMMWTNYPNMPTGAPASRQLYERLVRFGLEHNILICNDNPYSFILNDKPLSILSVPRARECCVELNSLSKAHNMSGWRVGMIAGESEYVSELLKVKSQMDSGMFKALQLAAVQALEQGQEWFDELNAEYSCRRERAGRIFDLLGARYNPDTAGLFLWGRIDRKYATAAMTAGEALSERILHEAGVFITPGFIFGKNGQDYIRISLCAKPELLDKAFAKIEKAKDRIL